MKDKRKNINRWLLPLVVFCFSFIAPALADIPASSQQEHTKITLVTEHASIQPGQPLQAGILIEAHDGWHTYWENPGDAGLPTRLKWTLPEGFTAGPIDWPLPQKMTEGPLVTYSYVGTVLLPVTITPTGAQSGNSYPLQVKVDVLVCKDICVPESATLQVVLPASSEESSPSPHASLFEKYRAEHPHVISQPGQYSVSGKQLHLHLQSSALGNDTIAGATFFIREQNVANYAAEQSVSHTNDTFDITLEIAGEAPQSSISGMLALTHNDGSTAAYDVSFTQASGAPAATPLSTVSPDAVSTPSLIISLLLAVAGGIVLNLMPCVLPILSLKALAIAQKSASPQEHVVRNGVAYTLGILCTFAIFASLLLILRGAGSSIGWGFQMQSPIFVGFLIYLLFLTGVSLSGWFHLPVLLGSWGSQKDEASVQGSFMTGVLATAVATPCTAPFMASAVGAALILPAWQAMLIFEALGFGLALPFLLISIFPALRRFLPKPGAWMERFKQLLAFPMYASVIWLLWVLTLQTGAGGMVVMLTGLLALAFLIYLKSWFENGSTRYRLLAVVGAALLVAMTLPMLSTMTNSDAPSTMESIPYSKDKLAQLRSAGTPVFVDATAAWCITCQVNIRTALTTDRVKAAFSDHHVAFMVADWTKPSDAITEYLRSFGFSGVPLAVFYPANGEPVVLPQILTEDIVINTITGGH